MSVVNRMLQDIDRRSGAAAIEAHGTDPDVCIVPLRAPHKRRNARLAGAVLLLIAGGALVAMIGDEWLPWKKIPVAALPQPALMAPPAAAAPTMERSAASGRAAEPASVAASVEGRPAPDAAPMPPVDFFKLSLSLSAPVDAPRAGEKARAGEMAKARATTGPSVEVPGSVAVIKPSREMAKPPAIARSTAEMTKAPAASKSPVAVRQVAAGETVAGARQLWDEGSRAGALATLREGLAAAEASRDAQATRLLALELARLEVAGNRPEAALEVLRRQAGLFGEDADLLALRGNAQQRLAMHSEAAESYLAALRLRPSEGKWMVGAAISLAAVGRTDEAKSLAGQARDRGAVTPPIAAYLQQLGVSTRP
jgi:hypothetical protein